MKVFLDEFIIVVVSCLIGGTFVFLVMLISSCVKKNVSLFCGHLWRWVRPRRDDSENATHGIASNLDSVVYQNDRVGFSRSGDHVPPMVLDFETPVKRFVIIDGAAVAYEYSKGAEFAVEGLKKCISYFKDQGHETIAIVSRVYEFKNTNNPTLMNELKADRCIVFTPQLNLYLDWAVPFDQVVMFLMADQKYGVIISNSDFTTLLRSFLEIYPTFQNINRSRVINFKWKNDNLELPRYPLGKGQATLHQILNY